MKTDNLTVLTICAVVLGLVAIVFVCISGLAGLFKYMSEHPPQIVCNETASIPIKSLSLGGQVRGSFVVGFGSVSNVEYYYIYQKDGDGWMFRKLYADRWKLVEGSELPHLRTEDCVYENTRQVVNRSLEIHVPVGTILEKYTADTGDLR